MPFLPATTLCQGTTPLQQTMGLAQCPQWIRPPLLYFGSYRGQILVRSMAEVGSVLTYSLPEYPARFSNCDLVMKWPTYF